MKELIEKFKIQAKETEVSYVLDISNHAFLSTKMKELGFLQSYIDTTTNIKEDKYTILKF